MATEEPREDLKEAEEDVFCLTSDFGFFVIDHEVQRHIVKITLKSKPSKHEVGVYKKAYMNIYNTYRDQGVKFAFLFDVRSVMPNMRLMATKLALTVRLADRTGAQVLGSAIVFPPSRKWETLLNTFFKPKDEGDGRRPKRFFTTKMEEAEAYVGAITEGGPYAAEVLSEEKEDEIESDESSIYTSAEEDEEETSSESDDDSDSDSGATEDGSGDEG